MSPRVFPETIETDSLALRRLSRDAVDPRDLYDRLGADAEGVDDVFAHVPQEPFATLGDAREWLVEAETGWDDGEVAQYGAFPTDGEAATAAPAAGEFAGFAALDVAWERRTGRPGVILARPFWGDGYAGECATALTDLALNRLDLDAVAVGYEAGNDRSRRVVESFVERYGGRKDGVLRNRTPLGDEIRDHHRYTVTRAEYRRAGGEDPDVTFDG